MVGDTRSGRIGSRPIVRWQLQALRSQAFPIKEKVARPRMVQASRGDVLSPALAQGYHRCMIHASRIPKTRLRPDPPSARSSQPMSRLDHPDFPPSADIVVVRSFSIIQSTYCFIVGESVGGGVDQSERTNEVGKRVGNKLASPPVIVFVWPNILCGGGTLPVTIAIRGVTLSRGSVGAGTG